MAFVMETYGLDRASARSEDPFWKQLTSEKSASAIYDEVKAVIDNDWVEEVEMERIDVDDYRYATGGFSTSLEDLEIRPIFFNGSDWEDPEPDPAPVNGLALFMSIHSCSDFEDWAFPSEMEVVVYVDDEGVLKAGGGLEFGGQLGKMEPIPHNLDGIVGMVAWLYDDGLEHSWY